MPKREQSFTNYQQNSTQQTNRSKLLLVMDATNGNPQVVSSRYIDILENMPLAESIRKNADIKVGKSNAGDEIQAVKIVEHGVERWLKTAKPTTEQKKIERYLNNWYFFEENQDYRSEEKNDEYRGFDFLLKLKNGTVRPAKIDGRGQLFFAGISNLKVDEEFLQSVEAIILIYHDYRIDLPGVSIETSQINSNYSYNQEYEKAHNVSVDQERFYNSPQIRATEVDVIQMKINELVVSNLTLDEKIMKLLNDYNGLTNIGRLRTDRETTRRWFAQYSDIYRLVVPQIEQMYQQNRLQINPQTLAIVKRLEMMRIKAMLLWTLYKRQNQNESSGLQTKDITPVVVKLHPNGSESHSYDSEQILYSHMGYEEVEGKKRHFEDCFIEYENFNANNAQNHASLMQNIVENSKESRCTDDALLSYKTSMTLELKSNQNRNRHVTRKQDSECKSLVEEHLKLDNTINATKILQINNLKKNDAEKNKKNMLKQGQNEEKKQIEKKMQEKLNKKNNEKLNNKNRKNKNKQKIEAVIFDLDGVLSDSEKVHLKTFNDVFREHAIKISETYWNENYTGRGSEFIVQDIIEKNSLDLNVEKTMKKRSEIFSLIVNEGKVRPIKGSKKLVRIIRNKGIKAIVASGGHKKHVKAQLKSIGLEDMKFLAMEDVKNRKPAPDVFLMAAKLIGVKPRNCIVIEDSKSGFVAAKRAKMKCALIGKHHSKKQRENADLWMQKLDVKKIINYIAKRL